MGALGVKKVNGKKANGMPHDIASAGTFGKNAKSGILSDSFGDSLKKFRSGKKTKKKAAKK